MKNIPVILVCYNRPKHTLEVLKALREHNIKNIYIFSDAPKSHKDTEAVSLTKCLVHSIDWTEPKIIERTENLGLARNVVSAVDYVFERYDRLILLEDDCVPQRYFFDFMHTCLQKYEDNPKIFGISGFTVKIPDELLESYSHDLYFCPRIGSWGWGTWRRAWKHRGSDLFELIDTAIKNNIDLNQGGTDIPVALDNILKGNVKDVWTLHWVLSVYLNNGVYVYPTRSHILNTGMDDTGIHCKKTDKYDSPCCDKRPVNYPDEVFLDKDMIANFKSYYDIDPAIKAKESLVKRNKAKQTSMKVCYINAGDIKGGANRVGWMLKQGLEKKGFQTAMFVKNKMSNDLKISIISDAIEDGNTSYKDQGFLYYDINSTLTLPVKEDFITSDLIHYHNLHGDYFNPFALPGLTKIKPSVWTLHDMQSMTGHCAYAFDCQKWQTGCGNCQNLKAYPAVTKDRTAEMWSDKKHIYEKSDFELIVPSQWLKNIVGKSILKDKKIHLIYNGIDERVYRPLDRQEIRRMFKIPQNAVIIGFVAHGGLLDERKGGKYLLEAYKYFTTKYPNAFFICIGGTSNMAPVKRFLQIPFLLDEKKLVQLYCTSDIFLFPTLADNCPLIVLELMGCGVPLVSFDIGGVPELIEHGRTGFIADYKNAEEFTKMAELLVLDKGKREQFGKAGIERLHKMFTLDQMIDKHIDLYEHLIEESNKKNYIRPKNKVSLSASTGYNQYKYLVSAIVSTYNSEKFLSGCLEDLEQQTIANKLEIIVVNSGSQENEEAIVHEYQQKYNNIVYIKTEQREGIYSAWNRGVKVARGTFLTNANTDDRHREDALEIMADTLLANPNIALVYGDQICTDTPNCTFANHHATKMAKRPEYSFEKLLFGCCVGSQPMWRKSLHNEFGYFDDTLICAGDWDFWLRISSKYKFKHIAEFLGLYYHNEDGIEHGNKIHSLYERYVVGKRYGNPYISVMPLYSNKDNPLVSVIMPAYNAVEYIAEAIESVLIQNYRNFELIVIDDGSTDNTRDIVAGFKDDKIKYLYKENAGPGSARNLGIKKSQGSFLIHLDADDMMTPDFISRHLQEFEMYPEVDLVYCDDCLIDKNSKLIRVIKRLEYTDRKTLIKDLFHYGFPVVPFRTCIRKSVFDKIGYFNEELLVGEDYDMIRRFVRHRLNIHHLPNALYLRRITNNSLSRNYSSQKAKGHFEVIKRFTDTFTYDELFPDIAWDEIDPRIRQLHAKCLTAGAYLAIGQEYVKSNALEYSKTAFDQACSELHDCIQMDPENQDLHRLFEKSQLIRARYLGESRQIVSR